MPAGDPPFHCTWRLEGATAATVIAAGPLTTATAPVLEVILQAALDDARLVLLDLRATGVGEAGAQVIAGAGGRARAAGKRLLVVGTRPEAGALPASPRLEWLATDAPEPRELGPPANPVNARVIAARVMAVPAPGVWLHGSDGSLRQAWGDASALPAGTPLELYLAHDDTVNGWREPHSGLAVNQRRQNPADAPATAAGVLCQGSCGVLWLAPDPTALLMHDEHCLTCAGPLALP